jgi:hypothetical protein
LVSNTRKVPQTTKSISNNKPESIIPIDELSMGTEFQNKQILKTENFD